MFNSRNPPTLGRGWVAGSIHSVLKAFLHGFCNAPCRVKREGLGAKTTCVTPHLAPFLVVWAGTSDQSFSELCSLRTTSGHQDLLCRVVMKYKVCEIKKYYSAHNKCLINIHAVMRTHENPQQDFVPPGHCLPHLDCSTTSPLKTFSTHTFFGPAILVILQSRNLGYFSRPWGVHTLFLIYLE